MRRAEYLKAQAAGRARAKRNHAAPARESSLARLRRERPEMFKRGYFLEPVLRWWPGWKPYTDPKSLDIGHSQRMSATRERLLTSDDAQVRWAAYGNLGELRKVRK